MATAQPVRLRGLERLRAVWPPRPVAYRPTVLTTPAISFVARRAPAGESRLVQSATGIHYTVVNGSVLVDGGEAFGLALSVKTGASGTLYFDTFASRRQLYMGPVQ